MLYEIAHYLRDHFGFIYDWLEDCNAWAFALRYREPLSKVDDLLKKDSCNGFTLRQTKTEDAQALADFFARQPESAFVFFRPHAFDAKTLQSLIARRSFLMFLVVTDEGRIVGYYFLRSFVHGVGYLGKIVDYEMQGKGIGKCMCLSAMHICQTLGIRMFESISKRNIASMKSSAAVLKQVIVEELDDDDLLIEDLPKSEI